MLKHKSRIKFKSKQKYNTLRLHCKQIRISVIFKIHEGRHFLKLVACCHKTVLLISFFISQKIKTKESLSYQQLSQLINTTAIVYPISTL